MSMSQPDIFTTPFAEDGDFTPLPLTTSPTVVNQILGFPPKQGQPYSGGGLPVAIAQMNGVLNSYSKQLVWQQGGGCFTFEADWVTANGGYDSGVILWYATAKRFVISLIADNDFDFISTPSYIDGTHWQYLDTYGFPNLLTINGYQKLPGGLIMQWGATSSLAYGTTTWTFPIAFPTGSLWSVICAGANDTTGMSTGALGLSGASGGATTSLTIFNYTSPTNTNAYYLVIGR